MLVLPSSLLKLIMSVIWHSVNQDSLLISRSEHQSRLRLKKKSLLFILTLSHLRNPKGLLELSNRKFGVFIHGFSIQYGFLIIKIFKNF